MYKRTIQIIFFLLVIFTFSIFYLSVIGIKTTKLNSLIEDEINKININLKTEIKDVSLILDLKKKELKTSTKDTDLYLNDKAIEISEINLNLDIFSFLKKKYLIKNLEIKTKDNNITDFISFLKAYETSFLTIFLEKIIKKGEINTKINFFFDETNGKFKDYEIEGNIENGNLKLLNGEFIENINFRFNINDKKFNFKDISFVYEKINLFLENINVNKKNKGYFVKGIIKNKKTSIDKKLINRLLEIDLKNLSEDKIKIETSNKFSFLINEKIKIKNLKINSDLKFEKLILKKDFKNLKNIFKNYDKNIILENGFFNINYSKDHWSIDGNSKYSFNKEFNNIKLNILRKNDKYFFDTSIDLDNAELNLKLINYYKDSKSNAKISLKGEYLDNKNINLKEIIYDESTNYFKILNLNLNNDFKIFDVQKIEINYLNNDKNLNELIFIKDNKNYILSGSSFDAIIFLDDLLVNKNNNNFFNNFINLNSKIDINFDKVLLDKNNYLINLNGNIDIQKNKIKNMNLLSTFPNKGIFSFSIKSLNDEKIVTTMHSDYAVPFVKRFKFIKGFEDGVIDYYSVKKNQFSDSTIKIFNFKVKKLPLLTKILSLASLQGIADLMTGEGIRFDEFEMEYEESKKLIKIKEIYSIGPAISILMDGYIELDNLVSLRGTLVPATTINKFVGSIPILGDILVGKKTGEGVFGVSFKIKGPPKDLKTTVNPVKTLTPRFITRTLEKIKKSN